MRCKLSALPPRALGKPLGRCILATGVAIGIGAGRGVGGGGIGAVRANTGVVTAAATTTGADTEASCGWVPKTLRRNQPNKQPKKYAINMKIASSIK